MEKKAKWPVLAKDQLFESKFVVSFKEWQKFKEMTITRLRQKGTIGAMTFEQCRLLYLSPLELVVSLGDAPPEINPA